MTINLALEYIPKRIAELGYKGYHIRFRHFVLQPGEEKFVSAFVHLFYLIEPSNDIKVESDTGLFDLSEDRINELHYEHRGEIYIQNLSPLINHLRMIQVIPKNC